MRLVVDTGVFSAALSRRRRAHFDEEVKRLVGNQLFLAAVTVAELRYGALVAGWGTSRRARLEQAIEATTVIPVSDALVTTVAQVRLACRVVGHPLADRVHANDLWVAASAIHIDTSLLTADNIFHETPGLTVISEISQRWTRPDRHTAGVVLPASTQWHLATARLGAPVIAAGRWRRACCPAS